MQTTTAGIFIGLILGLALVLEDFGGMLIVALFGAIGWVVARAIRGDLDLSQYIGGSQSQRRR